MEMNIGNKCLQCTGFRNNKHKMFTRFDNLTILLIHWVGTRKGEKIMRRPNSSSTFPEQKFTVIRPKHTWSSRTHLYFAVICRSLSKEVILERWPWSPSWCKAPLLAALLKYQLQKRPTNNHLGRHPGHLGGHLWQFSLESRNLVLTTTLRLVSYRICLLDLDNDATCSSFYVKF